MLSSRASDPWALQTARWLSVPLLDTKMDRINTAGFYLLGTKIRALLTLKAGMPVIEAVPILADADEFLEMLLNPTIGPKVEQSRLIAEELRRMLAHLTIVPPRMAKLGLGINTPHVINQPEMSAITDLVKSFEVAFCSEMPSKAIFYVTEKRAYSTDTLLSKAEEVLGSSTVSKLVPFEIENIREAGCCLVFDRFTAVGFHVLRATESVARRYFQLTTGRDPAGMTLGKLAAELDDYLQKLSKSKQPTGLLGLVTGPLEQLCKIYRNPISHPEIVALDEEQAVEAFHHAISVIGTMVRDMLAGGSHFRLKP